MTVSKNQVVDWCTQLIEKSSDFPSLEDCLATIPNLESLSDVPAGTKVLVRGDTDVVVEENGTIEDDIRLQSLIDTLKFGHQHGWIQLVYGHRGRDPQLSLEPVAKHLESLLGKEGISVKVEFISDWLDDETGHVLESAAEKVASLSEGSIVVLENTRKYQLEQLLWKAKIEELDGLSEKLTNYANDVREKLASIHVNEGFAASNRDLSSTLVPLSMERNVLGIYIGKELRDYVTRTRQADLVIFSGMKINKLDDLEQIMNRGKVKFVIAAGSLAISLKKAAADIAGEDFEMGLNGDPSQKIYVPPERIEQARRMLENGKQNGVEFILPVDFVLEDGSASDTIPAGGAQFDIGPKSSELQAEKVNEFIKYSQEKVAKGESPAVAFHNGVFGMFEKEEFSHGTRKFIDQLKHMTDSGVEVYVGGGEGGAALHRYGEESWVTHCFTAGGTILKALGSQPIPYIKALYLRQKLEG